MDIFSTIQQLDGATRVAIAGLALTTTGWLGAMFAGLVSRRPAKARLRPFEIAAGVFSLLLVGSMAHVGYAIDRANAPAPDAVSPSAPSSGGGTGTCASIRIGMTTSQVTSLLGKPSLDQVTEDARGPGARVLVFDDSMCAVHLIHGVVDQIE
jgi:hypothetical protein